MNTALWVLIAVVLGIILYSSIAEDIPDELSFLKPSPTANAPGTSGLQTIQYQHWTVRTSQSAVEVVARLQPGPQTKANLPPPEIGFLCHQGKLDARLDTVLPTTGAQATPVGFGTLGASTWEKGTGKNVFPPNAYSLSRYLVEASGAPVVVSLSYAEHGKQLWVLPGIGFGEISRQLPAGCR